jgi:hypothetical protein
MKERWNWTAGGREFWTLAATRFWTGGPLAPRRLRHLGFELAALEREEMRILLLNTKNAMLRVVTAYAGNVSASLVRLPVLYKGRQTMLVSRKTPAASHGSCAILAWLLTQFPVAALHVALSKVHKVPASSRLLEVADDLRGNDAVRRLSDVPIVG